jgi:hypothetical protein
MVWTDRASTPADTATAEYFASHGYVVAATSDTALDMTRALPFVDAARIARVELRPNGALLRAMAGGQVLVVDVPPGPSDHVRVSAAVTHAFLAAMLHDGSVPSELTRRLRAAGLVVRITNAPR